MRNFTALLKNILGLIQKYCLKFWGPLNIETLGFRLLNIGKSGPITHPKWNVYKK